MKPRDAKVKKLVKQVLKDCEAFLEEVGILGNQCAYTDRMIEQIIEDSTELKKTYEKQFEGE